MFGWNDVEREGEEGERFVRQLTNMQTLSGTTFEGIDHCHWASSSPGGLKAHTNTQLADQILKPASPRLEPETVCLTACPTASVLRLRGLRCAGPVSHVTHDRLTDSHGSSQLGLVFSPRHDSMAIPGMVIIMEDLTRLCVCVCAYSPSTLLA